MKDMGKTMKLIPFLSHSESLDSKPWPFPSCGNINTLSFRATNISKHYSFTTFDTCDMITTPDSLFTLSSSSSSSSSSNAFSTMSDDPIESVIRGLRSDRLFFEPAQSCSLVLDPQQSKDPDPDPVEDGWVKGSEGGVVYKESEALCMDSNNPCQDFLRSMEEMVEAHGLKDWQGLEELLRCYLKINHKINHGYIMGAFIDLLVNLSFISSTTTTTTTTTTSSSNSLSSTNLNCSSPSSPLSLPSSSLTTPCLSSLLEYEDANVEEVDDSVNTK